MRLISLNVWLGQVYEPLIAFLNQHLTDTDIFCFQEVYDEPGGKPPKRSLYAELYFEGKPDIYRRLLDHAQEFNGFISKPYSSLNERLAFLVRKSIKVNGSGEMVVSGTSHTVSHGKPFAFTPRLYWISFMHGRNSMTVANVHGLWIKDSKIDTPERIEQSRRIMKFIAGKDGGKILCGDFNLDIGTESIHMLENGMVNLIKEHGITSTRSRLYAKESKFADYVFISNGIKTRHFEVIDVRISDHLPLLLDFG